MGMKETHLSIAMRHRESEFLGRSSFIVAEIDQGIRVRARRKAGVRLREQQQSILTEVPNNIVGRLKYFYRKPE